MLNEPLVSIIIPLYNAEKYIAGTIRSAIDQTWLNKEIIIVNDGSTDNSLVIANQYASGDIKIISQPNKGASAARNTGLKEAQGKYIQFLDADDLISPNKITDQINLLINYPDHLGLCGTIHFQDGDDPLANKVQHDWFSGGSDDPIDFLIKLYGGALIGPEYGGMITIHSWLCPRHILDKVNGWNEELGVDDDGEYFCRVILASAGIKYASDSISYYRKFIGENNLSAQKTYDAYHSILRSTLLKADHLTRRTDNIQAKTALSRLLWDNALKFYPQYNGLALIAEKAAKKMAPLYNYNPYGKGLNFELSKVLGWKTVKYLQYLKRKI
jgi:glycosyltransferase involved in cell wall biosynthesis